MLTRLFLLVTIASCWSFARADVYSCVTPDGRSIVQSAPCARSKAGAEQPSVHVQPNPAVVDLNVPEIARKKCIEAGYDPESDATFATCTDDLRQTMYKRFCEQAGRAGPRLDSCVYQLRRHDDQYTKKVQLDYYCIARDKAFGTSQYKACIQGAK